MKLCIPTLCRYDLLIKLLQSVESGSELPDEYIIIDNGGELDLELLREMIESDRKLPIHFVVPGENWGVARSWNYAIELADKNKEEFGGIIISNDDVIFNHTTFQEMTHAVKKYPFVDGLQWALFGQNSECKERVGLYDQTFYPAYYEDTDYLIRMARAGIVPFNALSAPVEHLGWATTRASKDAVWINQMREKNRQYFIRKWGYNGPHENCVSSSYQEPFNGLPTSASARPEPNIRLSVIVPSINRNSLLRTIQSIAPQLASDDELIVVYDGPGYPYCELSTVKYKGSIVLTCTTSQTNNLGGAQRDLGMSLATGTHLMFCDDDDIFVPDALELTKAQIEKTPDVPLIFQMRYQEDSRVLWKIPEILMSNVGTPMFVVPRSNHLPK